MFNSYKIITFIRLLLACGIVYSVLFRYGFIALLLSILFVGLHWRAQHLGHRGGLNRAEYQFSSLVSSLSILAVFFILLRDEHIPSLLAALFVAVFVIKLLFSMQDEPMKSKVHKKKPLRTNWSLTASFMFLACYYFGDNNNLVMISAIILGYLLFSLGFYTKSIMDKKFKQNQALHARRR